MTTPTPTYPPHVWVVIAGTYGAVNVYVDKDAADAAFEAVPAEQPLKGMFRIPVAGAPEPSPGASRITAERARQVAQEGWSAGHDDRHGGWVLPAAARAYLEASDYADATGLELAEPTCWPWASASWKPSGDPLRNLAKAGALVAAEMDRLIRLQEGQP